MSDPLVHLVVTVVADQEGGVVKGEVVVFVGTEQMHQERLDMGGGPYELQRAALALHELGLEALDVLDGSRAEAAPPSPATDRPTTQRKPRRRSGQAPAKEAPLEAAAEPPQDQWVRTSSRPRSRRR